MQEAFDQFMLERFPLDAKRSSSGVVRAAFAEKIRHALKNPTAVDKNFRFYVKKTAFQVIDMASLGVQNVLVVPRKGTEVSTLAESAVLVLISACYI